MLRLERIARYREKALDLAATVAALSTARAVQPMLESLSPRQDGKLYDLLHDFAFVGRKLIALVRRESLQCVQFADPAGVACSVESADDDFESLEMLALQAILGRVIHSELFEIERARVPLEDGRLSEHQTAWGFQVTSDRDVDGRSQFVFIEFLLEEFLRFDDELATDFVKSSNL